MNLLRSTACILTLVVTAPLLSAFQGGQVVLPPGFQRNASPPPAQTPQQQQPPSTPPGQAPGAAAQPAPGLSATPPALTPETARPDATAGGLNIQGASLVEVIDVLARNLKINYILDPRVRGGVTINTYGDTKSMDHRTLLDTILRINGAAMIQVGDLYRIVPLSEVQRLPLQPEINGKPNPEDDRTMLNLVFLKFATVDELAKLLEQFLGEGAKMWSYPAANLLIVQDSRRNMKRLMELVGLFDSNTFANQRVRLFEVKNSRPSDIAKELDGILKSISLNDKNSPIRLLPVDRINTLIAVAPNPGVFTEVEAWITKLDLAVESSAGSLNNYVYRVKYGFAPTIAMAIMGLYSNNPMAAYSLMMMSGMGGGMMGGGMMGGGMGMGGGMMGGMGGGMYGGGMGGGYGGGMMGGGMGGMYGGGMGGMMGGAGYTAQGVGVQPVIPVAPTVGNAGAIVGDRTGTYLTPGQGADLGSRGPKIIPNPFDNTLLIQGTREEYDSILRLLRDIDVAPRQVLIEAKIYEVALTGALASGVSAFLQQRGADSPGTDLAPTRKPLGSLRDGVSLLSAGTLVGQTRELLAFLSLQETSSKARVLSAPSVIATDSVPAAINVGTEVPTLTAQAVTDAQSGGSSLFANSIQTRNSGVTLAIVARVNPSGIVTLMVQQEVSSPQAPSPTAAIQSPSFSKRSVQTQVTVQDGDTIAIGGIINETNSSGSAGIPGLQRIPILGAAFGSRSYSKERTELIIFLTPRVIYDMNDVVDATEELKSGLRKLNKYIRE